MESQSQMSAVRRRDEGEEVIEETGADEGERLGWISYALLLKLSEASWREVLADPLRALCLQTACDRLTSEESQDLVIRIRLRLLNAPPFGAGLDGFNIIVADALDAQKLRRAARASYLKKSVPPKSDHLAA